MKNYMVTHTFKSKEAKAKMMELVGSMKMEDIMIHEVFDYNKTFNKAADAGKNFKKPGE